jgi:hypothetical protein
MRLYVCWGTFSRDGQHPCGNAYDALVEAGHGPEVTRTYGCFRTDPLFGGRRKIKAMRNYKVPTLELDDGRLVDGSGAIIQWARANPKDAPMSERTGSGR